MIDENSSNDSDEAVVSLLIDLIITELESMESTMSTVTVMDQTIKTSTRDVKLPTRILRSHVRQRFHPFELFHRQCRLNGKTIKGNDFTQDKSIDLDHQNRASIENRDGNSSLSLPPNKRRLREHHIESNETLASENYSNPVVQPLKKDVPTNSIEKYLRIRQQIAKRHENLLNQIALPNLPRDFLETSMARKHYLIAKSSKSFTIERCSVPSDLDPHLAEIFLRQEDERYRMKLRHQVERDKLILSHEHEMLRLYVNAERLSRHQEFPLSFCSWLKDTEIYQSHVNLDLTKSTKPTFDSVSFFNQVNDCNKKYQRLSIEITQRHFFEADTLHAMQKMIWSKYFSKDNSFRFERYVPRIEIQQHFCSHISLQSCSF